MEVIPMRKYIYTFTGLLAFAALSAGTAHGITISDKAGTATGEFLRIGAGARPAAMGEAYTAVADDVNSLYWNPAGLAKVKSRELQVSHAMLYMDINHEYAAYVHPLKEGWGAAGISFTYLMTTFDKRAGDTDVPDSSGNVGDMAIGLSYGRELLWGVRGGATVKFINSTLDSYSASTIALDAGFQYTLPQWNKLILGLSFSNLGGSLTYIEKSVAVANTGSFGLAVKDAFLKNLTMAADARTVLNTGYLSVNTGAEYAYVFGNGITVAPRIGFESYAGLFTAGFGIGWKAYQLDYAFMPNDDLGSSNRLTFNIKF